MQNTKGQTT